MGVLHSTPMRPKEDRGLRSGVSCDRKESPVYLVGIRRTSLLVPLLLCTELQKTTGALACCVLCINAHKKTAPPQYNKAEVGLGQHNRSRGGLGFSYRLVWAYLQLPGRFFASTFSITSLIYNQHSKQKSFQG